jgi:hypothetical protein
MRYPPKSFPMKNKSVISFGLALAAFSFFGCNKSDDQIYEVNFFTSKANGVHTLYIDGVQKGALDYFPEPPECGQQFADGAKPLKAQLPSGTYSITGRNAQGHVTTQATVTLSESVFGTSGGTGGTYGSKNKNCVIIGLSE